MAGVATSGRRRGKAARAEPERPGRGIAQAPGGSDRLATGSGAPAAQERSLERELGSQIRLARRRHDLTMTDLAHAAGISTGMLSKIETGRISPSLSTLQAVAGALNVSLGSLFSAFEERRDCSFVPSGQGVVIERRGTKAGHIYDLLGHVLGGAVAVEPFLITLKAGAVPYTGFQHAGTEFIYMLTGEVVYRHGEATYHLRPGDSLLFDAMAPHGPEDLLVLPMTYLSIITYQRDPA